MFDILCITSTSREPGQFLAQADEVAPGGCNEMVARVEGPAMDKRPFEAWSALGSDQVGRVLGEATDVPRSGLVGDLVDGTDISRLMSFFSQGEQEKKRKR